MQRCLSYTPTPSQLHFCSLAPAPLTPHLLMSADMSMSYSTSTNYILYTYAYTLTSAGSALPSAPAMALRTHRSAMALRVS